MFKFYICERELHWEHHCQFISYALPNSNSRVKQ